MKILYFFFLFLSSKRTLLKAENNPQVTIADGTIKGSIRSTIFNAVTYFAFRGIPYAKPPLGDLRFAAPIKNEKWQNVLDGTSDKDKCIQQTTSYIPGSNMEIIGSEDCLYINVYTRDLQGAIPVMIWIHGGSFVGGSSSYEDFAPDAILEQNVVYVAFNYRLGVFGFLSTEDEVAPGNWGMKDQVMALKWVKDNIKAFGGDPDKITIFGESAGAVSVSYLVISLFNGAIMQSGTSLSSFSLTREAKTKTKLIAASLGIFNLTSRNIIESLRKVDYRKLKSAENNIETWSYILSSPIEGLTFGVVKEPELEGAFFTNSSWELMLNGDFERVPLIIGHNSNELEATIQTAGVVAYLSIKYGTIAQSYKFAPDDLTNNFFANFRAGLEIKAHYFGNGLIVTQPKQLSRFLSVDEFVRPSREAITLMSKYVPVYYYEFTYKGKLGDPMNNYTGTVHTEELKYLFANVRPTDKSDQVTISNMVTLWTNFAKTLNPTSSQGALFENSLGDLKWIPNNATDVQNTVNYLNIGSSVTMGVNPFHADWSMYQKIYKDYGQPPYSTY